MFTSNSNVDIDRDENVKDRSHLASKSGLVFLKKKGSSGNKMQMKRMGAVSPCHHRHNLKYDENADANVDANCERTNTCEQGF